MKPLRNTITPVLTVRQAAEAMRFYTLAFGATEVYRNTYSDKRIVAEMTVGDARLPWGSRTGDDRQAGPVPTGTLAVVAPSGLSSLVPEPDWSGIFRRDG